ncbi:hypothetical protein JCGZ_19827 [Jatropha curcas]|uniref:Uncharacterized protein n=1 Tax=Jatropha curcas TaxID=180498 RepID=A0A067K7F0_JATCU|nr:hypothetical protein JCGZ_19827 [Jatropha curcas]
MAALQYAGESSNLFRGFVHREEGSRLVPVFRSGVACKMRRRERSELSIEIAAPLARDVETARKGRERESNGVTTRRR